MTKKENRILFVSAFIFLLMVVGIAYAYYAEQLNLNSANIIINVDSTSPSFVAYSTGDLNLNVPLENLVETSLEPAATSSSNYVVSLTSFKEGSITKCTYDLAINYGIKRQTSAIYTPIENYNYELSIKATRTTTGDTSESVYINKDISETEVTQLLCDPSSYSSCSSYGIYPYTLVSGAEIYSASLNPTITNWNFEVNYYSIPKSQNIIEFTASIAAVNVVCT